MTTPATTPAPGAAPAAPGAATRLPSGELRRMVAEQLASDPTAALTPGAIAAKLGGKSSGAVGNALATLESRGEAERVGINPVTYRATSTTADAAKTATVNPRGTTPAPPPPAPSAPPVAPPAAPTVVTGPVRRPNGQMYHPRKLGGMSDVTALRTLREAGVFALVYGPPGTGKTSLIEAAFPDLVTLQGDSGTVVDDFVGSYTQTPDGYEFCYGPLVTAMREGRPLFIDDATLIPPTELAVVYPAMDGRGQITIKSYKGEVVDAADGFYVVAGHNPGVHGAVLTDALSSRFGAQIKVSTDYDLALQLKVDEKAVRVAKNLALRQEKGEIGWAPQLRELLEFARISRAVGADFAAGNLIGVAPEEDREVVAVAVRNVFGANVIPLALGSQF
ncbi:AAA domain (dynein-related subfamily) [Amycolatopsis tolypomycina]|uniref:AAA domain (Dynein-related subfamily) n=1 Tax=Amycolatopsis tolypomycina TaxID=208445 RepID=A0A1H4JL10_9PSEU|nr:AAA family ATPase [Amycolatopsis tolypomycina]SEB46322.1 AAA domain (dynein-related subfamily) [Amycolatopsis tolypomycina]